MDVCNLQEVRWKNKGTRFLGVFGRRYKLWSRNSSSIGGVEILVKELCEKVVDIRRKSGRVMVVVLAFGEQVKRVISAYGQQQGGPLKRSTNSMTNWQANTSCRILVKWYSDWEILMDMLMKG